VPPQREVQLFEFNAYLVPGVRHLADAARVLSPHDRNAPKPSTAGRRLIT
jgi:hypothetical protein